MIDERDPGHAGNETDKTKNMEHKISVPPGRVTLQPGASIHAIAFALSRHTRIKAQRMMARLVRRHLAEMNGG